MIIREVVVNDVRVKFREKVLETVVVKPTIFATAFLTPVRGAKGVLVKVTFMEIGIEAEVKVLDDGRIV